MIFDIREAERNFQLKKTPLEKEAVELEKQISAYLSADQFSAFVAKLMCIRAAFHSSAPSVLDSDTYGEIFLGEIRLPLPIPKSLSSTASRVTCGLYDKVENRISVPLSLSVKKGAVVIADYSKSSESTVLAGIQNLIYNTAKYYRNDFARIFYSDPIRFNASSLGGLAPLSRNCGGTFIDAIPTSVEELRKELKAAIVRLNLPQRAGKAKELYVFHNFPHGYSSDLVTQIQQLCVNAEYYGIIVFLVKNNSLEHNAAKETMSFLETIAIHINSKYFRNTAPDLIGPFEWYSAPPTLPSDIAKIFKEEKTENNASTDYAERIGLPNNIAYKKGKRKLSEIPFGVDKHGDIQRLDFENSNFATFICGASRSGKSTLLHTLISGFIENNHPDDIEIWLIDFKMTEFSRYINHLPPHIRYILLDESPELVYDIIDRLTEILLKRQNIFKGKWQKLSDVPAEKYMPAIMVIIDEFSVMSQILADSALSSKENYAVKLQMLLAKGAALGFHFIFASQGFTSGTRGLNDFSKKQVQQRIAMKTEFNEIKDTLDLKSASEDDKLLMEQLPVHCAITRIPADEHGNHLKLNEVLFISDYTAQENMIDAMNTSLRPVSRYVVDDLSGYINKKTLIIDGSTYNSFRNRSSEISQYLKSSSKMLQENQTYALFIGEPRRMMPIFPVQVIDEFCENILMIVSSGEKEAATSVILSIMESLKLQGINYEIWSPRRNPIYEKMKTDCFSDSFFVTDLERICGNIKKLKRCIQEEKEANRFYILFGAETFLANMSFQMENQTTKNQPKYEKRAPGEADIMTQLALKEKGELIEEIVAAPKDEHQEYHDVAYDAREDLKYIFTHGPRFGYHFIVQFGTCGDVQQSKFDVSLFKHKILFRAARSDASILVGGADAAIVADLQDHSFRYTNGLEGLSFRPYLHRGVSLDGWYVDDDGVISSSNDEEEYLL